MDLPEEAKRAPSPSVWNQSFPSPRMSEKKLKTIFVAEWAIEWRYDILSNLAIFTTLSLFILLAIPAPHLLSLFLAHQPSRPWKSQIAHLDLHHLVFGINYQIHSVSLTILVSIHLLIHFSTHLCHHSHSRHPSLFHSRLKTYLFNKSYSPHISFTYWTAWW